MRTRIESIREINELLEKYNVPVWSEDDFFDHSFTGNETLYELEGIASDIASDYQTARAYKKAYFDGNGWEL
jgi:hypothetical protein